MTTFASNEIIAKFLALLKEAVPSLTRLAVLFSTEQVVNSEHKVAMAAAGRSLGIQLDEIEVGTLSDLPGAVRRVKDRGAEALFVWPTGFAFSFAKQISEIALTRLQDHSAIATAVLVGDRRHAEIAMRWHVKYVRELLSRLPRPIWWRSIR